MGLGFPYKIHLIRRPDSAQLSSVFEQPNFYAPIDFQRPPAYDDIRFLDAPVAQRIERRTSKRAGDFPIFPRKQFPYGENQRFPFKHR